MYRRALKGYERSLGKEHEDTKSCAKNMIILYQGSVMYDKKKTGARKGIYSITRKRMKVWGVRDELN